MEGAEEDVVAEVVSGVDCGLGVVGFGVVELGLPEGGVELVGGAGVDGGGALDASGYVGVGSDVVLGPGFEVEFFGGAVDAEHEPVVVGVDSAGGEEVFDGLEGDGEDGVGESGVLGEDGGGVLVVRAEGSEAGEVEGHARLDYAMISIDL